MIGKFDKSKTAWRKLKHEREYYKVKPDQTPSQKRKSHLTKMHQILMLISMTKYKETHVHYKKVSVNFS